MSEQIATRPVTLVWIDAREAIIVRVRRGRSDLVRLTSDVPAHHRATGHVRHDPAVRHGGGGRPQTAGEPRRLQHLGRFVTEVTDRLTHDGDLLVMGPGTVRERLARRLRASDVHHGRQRTISCEAAPRLTERQLVARLHRAMGVEPRRHTVGAYRWSRVATDCRRGHVGRSIGVLPRRVVEKATKPGDDR
jgi:hypothetical protein